MNVIVDSREKEKYFNFVRDMFPSHNVVREACKTGDYLSDKVIVERKALEDLHQSIFKGRLAEQVERMSLIDGMLPALLITGNVGEYIKNMESAGVEQRAEMLFSSIAEYTTRYNIPVFWVEDVLNGLIVVVKFMEKVEEGIWMMPIKRDPDALCARLLKIKKWQWMELKRIYGPSIEDIAMCESSEFRTISGIGPKRAEFIKKVLCKNVI